MDQSERIAEVPAGRFAPFSCASRLWTRWENLLHRRGSKTGGPVSGTAYSPLKTVSSGGSTGTNEKEQIGELRRLFSLNSSDSMMNLASECVISASFPF